MAKNKQNSVVASLLWALIPYSEENMNLVFRPRRFFYELEKSTNANRNTLAATMSRARRQGLVKDKDGIPTLTAKGRQRITEVSRPELQGWLMVTFDIPETKRNERNTFRRYLKLNKFQQIQKSIWCSREDFTEELKEVIAELKLGRYVYLFVAASIYGSGVLSRD